MNRQNTTQSENDAGNRVKRMFVALLKCLRLCRSRAVPDPSQSNDRPASRIEGNKNS